MTWRRLPCFLPNLSLKLLPLDQAARDAYAKTGFLSRLTFRVPPSTNKASGGGWGAGGLRWRGSERRALSSLVRAGDSARTLALLPGRDPRLSGERVRAERGQREHAELRGQEEARQAWLLPVRTRGGARWAARARRRGPSLTTALRARSRADWKKAFVELNKQ